MCLYTFFFRAQNFPEDTPTSPFSQSQGAQTWITTICWAVEWHLYIVSFQIEKLQCPNVPLRAPLWFRDWCSLFRNGLPDILHLSQPARFLDLEMPMSTPEEGTQASCFNCPLLELLRRGANGTKHARKHIHTPIFLSNKISWLPTLSLGIGFPHSTLAVHNKQKRLATPL